MIPVTNEKDFGEQVYRLRRDHCGVLLLRLRDERATNKIAVLRRLLTHQSDRLENQFVVVTESRVRFASRLGKRSRFFHLLGEFQTGSACTTGG